MDIMSEVKKDWEDVSAGIDNFFLNPIYKNFVRNMTSKLARSTLTSGGTIRVKEKQRKIALHMRHDGS
jgi:hypothetical protein